MDENTTVDLSFKGARRSTGLTVVNWCVCVCGSLLPLRVSTDWTGCDGMVGELLLCHWPAQVLSHRSVVEQTHGRSPRGPHGPCGSVVSMRLESEPQRATAAVLRIASRLSSLFEPERIQNPWTLHSIKKRTIPIWQLRSIYT